MCDLESKALDVVGGVMGSVPENVKISFFQAIGNLLGGLTSIPAAKLKQYAQGIEDTTAARSMASAMLSKAAAEVAINDPLVIQATAEIYLPTSVRKAKNRINVAQSAAKHLAEEAPNYDSGKAQSPDDDWMNRFSRFAEDSSSENLQDLFGKILAGQILRPRAFGLATLRTVSELDQDIAKDFTEAWASSVGDAVDCSSSWDLGPGFERWKRLSEFGLMAPTFVRQYLPPFNPIFDGSALWAPMNPDGVSLLVYFSENAETTWKHIAFTRVGLEIGSLLDKPDYEANIREASKNIPRAGLTRMELIFSDREKEIIWQSTSNEVNG